MLNTSPFLDTEKYLLACSGGVDSIALFHLMLKHKLKFEVASVNYNFREAAIDEINNVRNICIENNIKFHLYENTKSIENNTENQAREIRYSFFKKLMDTSKYKALVTGHNLNDKVEWFLMQFTKGAGISELTGMELTGHSFGFNTIKPLIEVERTDIENFLISNKIKHFHDSTNADSSYHPIDNPIGIRRNYFRHNFASKLTHEFQDGIKRSFSILKEEVKELEKEFNIKQLGNCKAYKIELNKGATNVIVLKSIDKTLKKYFKHVLTTEQRLEITKQKDTGIVLNDIAIGFSENTVFITPYITTVKLDKRNKDSFRKAKIPPKNRGYFQTHNILTELKENF